MCPETVQQAGHLLLGSVHVAEQAQVQANLSQYDLVLKTEESPWEDGLKARVSSTAVGEACMEGLYRSAWTSRR